MLSRDDILGQLPAAMAEIIARTDGLIDHEWRASSWCLTCGYWPEGAQDESDADVMHRRADGAHHPVWVDD